MNIFGKLTGFLVGASFGIPGILLGLVLGHMLDMALERVAKTSGGRIELTFRSGGRSVTRTHDRVVLAIPFSVLRTVTLDASLALPAWKTTAINTLGYGDTGRGAIREFPGRGEQLGFVPPLGTLEFVE